MYRLWRPLGVSGGLYGNVMMPEHCLETGEPAGVRQAYKARTRNVRSYSGEDIIEGAPERQEGNLGILDLEASSSEK